MGSSFIKNFLRQYCLCLYIHACIFKLILSTYSCHQRNGPSLIFQVEFYVTHSYLSFSGEFDIVQMLHYPPRTSAVKRSIGSKTGCTITEKAPTRAFSWLKAHTSAFTFKTLCLMGVDPTVSRREIGTQTQLS